MAQPFFNSNYGSPLMRVDNSGIQQAGQAYGQMFANLGKIAANTIDKYVEGKKKKEEQDELIKGTKAFIMGNPELGRMLNIQATDDISYEEAVDQAVPSLVKNPKGFEMIKGIQAMADQRQKAQQATELYNRAIAADKRKIADRQREVNFNRFLGQPGKPMVDPSGPDRNSVLRNLRAGKGATPPARMIPGPSPAEGMLTSPQAKNFIRKAVGAGQPMSEALPMAQKLDSQIAAQTPKPPTRSDILAREKFEYEKALEAKENEPLAPVDPVYKESAIDAIDKAIEKSQSFFATGVTGQLLQGIAGTDARDLAAAISTVEAAVGFDRLQEMRDASKTGGALGAINTKELQLLSASLGSLDPLQKPETLRDNLISIRERYVKVLKSVEAEKYAFEQGLVFNTPQEAMAFVNNFNSSSPQQTANAIDPADLENAVQAKRDLLQRRKLMSSQNEVGISPVN
jgi:hypothetical protein